MQFDIQPCQHQLNRPPDLVTDAEGVSYLRLDSLDEIDGEFILPPDGKRA